MNQIIVAMVINLVLPLIINHQTVTQPEPQLPHPSGDVLAESIVRDEKSEVKMTSFSPLPKPTKAPPQKVEVALFHKMTDAQIPYLCQSDAVSKLKDYEPKMIEATKKFRACDATPIEEAISKGYLCKSECPPGGGQCTTVCPETATAHLKECQDPALPTWNEWNKMVDTYCVLKPR